MAVQQGRADGQEVRVARVVDLDDAPGVLPGADAATADLDDVLGADDGEGHETPQLGVLLDRVLVVLLDVVGEVVDRDAVVLDVLHDELLGLGQLGGREGVGAADDGDDVDAGGEPLHQLDVQLAEPVSSAGSRSVRTTTRGLPVARRRDEVEHGVDPIVPEAGVTLNTGLLRKDIVILPLQVADDLGEAGRKLGRRRPRRGGDVGTNLASLSTWSPKPGVSTMVSEMRVPSSSSSSSVGHVRNPWVQGPGRISARKHTDGEGLDLDAVLDVRGRRIVRLLVGQDRLAAERVHEGGPAWDDPKSASALQRWGRCSGVQRTRARGAADHQAELDALLDVLLPADHLLHDHGGRRSAKAQRRPRGGIEARESSGGRDRGRPARRPKR